ncbi:hypothetical protein [Opitutus sp. ER46]|uniref:hypothetical protein n=1 Tax=Opitutus sp. ER46 TaxID=2161864 RepID=UPI000D31AA1F|nr:hypothetical protein [Opitutus sp. ER46]PTX95598.1 hypothetical protein DB354_09280 [Opitutus sp. ER46]
MMHPIALLSSSARRAPRLTVASCRRCALLAVLAFVVGVAGAAEPILGTRPGYTRRRVKEVPNDQAFGLRIWAPGLDAGYIPQGLTTLGGRFLVSGYYDIGEKKQAHRPCMVFQVDPTNGAVTGQFDLPEEIHHAGGLAADAEALYVADLGVLLRVDVARSLAEGHAVVTGRREVNRKMGPSFLAFGDGALWFGLFVREPEAHPELFAVPLARIFRAGAEEPLQPRDARLQIPLPVLAQGAAVDAEGRVWISASVQKSGWLYRIDTSTGRVMRKYGMPGGIEDLAHVGDALWAVGESGSQRWVDSPMFFPLLFEINPKELVAE